MCESPTWFEDSDLLLPTALAPVVDHVHGEVKLTNDAERDIEGGRVSGHDDGWRVMDVATSTSQTPRQAEWGTATERTTHKYVNNNNNNTLFWHHQMRDICPIHGCVNRSINK